MVHAIVDHPLFVVSRYVVDTWYSVILQLQQKLTVKFRELNSSLLDDVDIDSNQ